MHPHFYLSWELLTTLAVLGVPIVLLAGRRREHLTVAWWVAKAPLNKPSAKLYGALLTLVLLTGAWRIQAYEYLAVQCGGDQLHYVRKTADGSYRSSCDDFAVRQGSILQIQIAECKATGGDCFEKLANDRARFSALGFETDLATARLFLALVFSLFMVILAAVLGFDDDEEADGPLAHVMERRVVRFAFLAICGWTMSYVVGYTNLVRFMPAWGDASSWLFAALAIISALVAAAKTRHVLGVIWVLAVLIGGALIVAWEQYWAFVPIAPAIATISAIACDLFVEEGTQDGSLDPAPSSA